ncbi:kinetochore protein Nuf2 [Nematocida sp. AWRm77]|nr:kinetochore protein Nuf2 [Nematocida sp. AWRm77]
MHTYTIPNMSIKEIVGYLSDNGFNIMENDIAQPNVGYVSRLYEAILGVFAEERIPEGIDESTCLVLIYAEMKKFLESIGFGLFQMRDLLHPETGRLVKVLSTVVNFALFKESKKDVYTSIYRKREEIEAAIEECGQEIEQKAQVLKSKREEKNAAQRNAKAIQEQIKKKEAAIVNFHRTQNSILSNLEEIKGLYTETVERVNNEKCLLINITQEIVKLKAKIVKNPEQLKELLISMKRQNHNEEEILREYEKRITYLHKNIGYLKSVIEDLRSFVCTVSLVGENRSRLSSDVLSLKRIECENENLEIDSKSKEAKRNLLEKKVAYIVDKMTTLTTDDEARMSSIKKEFDKLREKHTEVLQEREKIQQMMQKNNENIKDLEKEIISLEASHDSMLSSVYGELVRKKAFLAGYSEDMSKVFKGEYRI